MSEKIGPLTGMRVLEMATHVAVPSCGRILAEMGAEVIKLENISGDPYRKLTTAHYRPNEEEQPLHDCLNCYKKSISVNMKDPRVCQYIHKLIRESDVFLSNVRLGGLERLGLTYELLKEVNPQLVYAHFSGYGEKGPKSKKPGYDSTAFFAQSGIYRDFVTPEAPPLTHIGGLGDGMAGLALCVGVLGAWINAQRTGKGTQVTSALNGSAAWGMMTPLTLEQYGSHYQREYGDPMSPVEASFRCSDGVWVFIVAGVDKQWKGLMQAIKRPELIDDPRYLDAGLRSLNSKGLFSVIASELEKKPYLEWESILQRYDVPFERIRHVREMAGDEQLIVNGYMYGIVYPSRKVWLPRPPFKMECMKDLEPELGAQVGQHTKEVFLSLGCSKDELLKLVDDGALRIWEES